MANILVNIEKGIEIGAEDALKRLVSAGKAFHAAPAAIAALEKTIVEIRKEGTVVIKVRGIPGPKIRTSTPLTKTCQWGPRTRGTQMKRPIEITEVRIVCTSSRVVGAGFA